MPRLAEMPRACPVEAHDRCYPRQKNIAPGCHGLVPWRLTIAATPRQKKSPGCHGLAPWRLTIAATQGKKQSPGCHGLVPWSFTIAANPKAKKHSAWMPRACPVELHVWSYIARNVSLHGTSPWHPEQYYLLLYSGNRDNSTGQARGISCRTSSWHLQLRSKEQLKVLK